MLAIRVIFGLWLLAAGLSPAAGQPFFISEQDNLHIPVIITIPDQVTINTERLYLGDIVHCSGYELYCEEAYSVDLGAAPDPGRRTIVKRKDIAAILAKEWPLAIIDYAGGIKVRVAVEATNLSLAQVEGEFLATLTPLFEQHKDLRFRIERIQVPLNVKVLPGEFELLAPDLAALKAKSMDWVVNRVDGSKRFRFVHRPQFGTEETPVFVRSRIIVERQLPVAAERIGKGAVVKALHLTNSWVRDSKIRYGALSEPEEIVGKTTRRTIRVGQPFLKSALVVPNVVRRGQELTVTFRKGGLVLTRQGKALKSGRQGDKIPMEMGNRQRIKARIIDKERAEFLF